MNSCSRNPDHRSELSRALLLARLLGERGAYDSSRGKLAFPQEGRGMNQQTQPSPREHHFYVAIAKFLFHHPEHGIVSVRDPIKIKDAERYALENLRTIVVRT